MWNDVRKRKSSQRVGRSLDLEEYDYRAGSESPIRATEKTVVDDCLPEFKFGKTRRWNCLIF